MIKLLDLTTSLQEKWGLKEHVNKLTAFWNKSVLFKRELRRCEGVTWK